MAQIVRRRPFRCDRPGVTAEGLALIERAKPAWDEAQARAAALLGEEGKSVVVGVGSRLMAGQEGTP